MGTESTTAPSSSADLLRLATGFWDARALAVAVELDLFTVLAKALASGQPQMGGHTELDGESDEAALRRFVESMDMLSAPCGTALAATFDWSGPRTLVDLGGGRGNVVATVLGAHPHLRGTSFDLPNLRPLFDEHVARLGLADRMCFHAGDFFHDELPPADVYLLGHLLADLDSERCEQLVTRAAEALPPGGMVLIYDAMIDPDRPQTWRNWLLMLNLQLVAPGGTGYRTEDCQSWLTRAGLVDVGARTLVDHETLVTGVKPRP